MEKVRNRLSQAEIFKEYTPFWGIPKDRLCGDKWQIVCFISPFCDGTCAHCWSSETFLGRFMPIEWYDKFWMQVKSTQLEEVRLTGGEPFLYHSIGELIDLMRKHLGGNIPIRIFTSGRGVVSLKKNEVGVEETVNALLARGVVKDNVEIQLSADEYHAGALYRANLAVRERPRSQQKIEEANQLGVPLLQIQAKNFLSACDILKSGKNGDFSGGKLKIHAATGRLDHHRSVIFSWLTDEKWNTRVIASEGLIMSGAAVMLNGSLPLTESDQLSLFIFPGAEFYQEPITEKAQTYQDHEKQRQAFLDIARKEGQGAAIIGWWNVINRVFCGGSAYDALEIIS